MRRSVALLLGLLPMLGGCATLRLGGGPGLDAGTLAVSGVESGVGIQLEALGYREREGVGVGLGPSLQIAGYQGEGDGDPIGIATLDVRWRRSNAARYLELGSGLGAAFSPGLSRAAIPLQAEVGLRRMSGQVELALGLRERFVGLIGDGSPPLDAHNSVQLVLRAGLVTRR